MSIKYIKPVLGLLTLATAGGFLLIWFGVFNVAATDKHWGITRTFLEWVRERSINSNMEQLKAPDLTDEKLIAGGAPNYQAMCVQCHLAPGIKTSEFYQGLNPKPPVFYKGETHDRDPVAAFWIIKNGIKMTGMASWGQSHSDKQIWELIAFINAMPGMGPIAYKKMVGDGEHTHKGSTGAAGHHATSQKSVTQKPANTTKGHHSTGQKATNTTQNHHATNKENKATSTNNQASDDHHAKQATGKTITPETKNQGSNNTTLSGKNKMVDHHGNTINTRTTNIPATRTDNRDANTASANNDQGHQHSNTTNQHHKDNNNNHAIQYHHNYNHDSGHYSNHDNTGHTNNGHSYHN